MKAQHWNSLASKFNDEALAVVSRYKRCEIDLIEILQRGDDRRIFGSLGFNSLFRYASDGLGLSEEVAYMYINVARKAKQVPALKAAIRSGKITITKAKKITPVLNTSNQTHWLKLAETCSKAKLEREVAKIAPATAVPTILKFVHPTDEIPEQATLLRDIPRVQLQVGISEALMLKIRRAQDLVSQKSKLAASLEATLDAAISQYLEKEDPVRKAQRQIMRGNARPLNAESVKVAVQEKVADELVPGPVAKAALRRPIPARTKHQVIIKFSGRCSYKNKLGERCRERRFLEIHHLKAVAECGGNDIDNLTLLCSGHHRAHHL